MSPCFTSFSDRVSGKLWPCGESAEKVGEEEGMEPAGAQRPPASRDPALHPTLPALCSRTSLCRATTRRVVFITVHLPVFL